MYKLFIVCFLCVLTLHVKAESLGMEGPETDTIKINAEAVEANRKIASMVKDRFWHKGEQSPYLLYISPEDVIYVLTKRRGELMLFRALVVKDSLLLTGYWNLQDKKTLSKAGFKGSTSVEQEFLDSKHYQIGLIDYALTDRRSLGFHIGNNFSIVYFVFVDTEGEEKGEACVPFFELVLSESFSRDFHFCSLVIFLNADLNNHTLIDNYYKLN